MLFIENYDAQSLDRSSVSMIDKFNGRLALVGELLSRLMALVDSLLATITDIRKILGVCKTRIYNNLEQVKEVVSGNGITGAEGTIQAIEDALKAGDEAISKAQTTLEGIKEQESCNQETAPTTGTDNACGETAPQSEQAIESKTEEETENCTFCSYGSHTTGGTIEEITQCNVCEHDGCTFDVSCNEARVDLTETVVVPCTWSVEEDATCGEIVQVDVGCGERSCTFTGTGDPVGPDCTFDCNHETPCQESPMPENCTYTCADGAGCTYGGTDCTYGTTCAEVVENEVCGQTPSDECGEACGETCHMTTEPEEHEGCSEGDCGESGCGNCGEQGCDETGTEQGCAEESCGEGSCGML